MILSYTIRKKLSQSQCAKNQWCGYLTPVEIMQILGRDKVTVNQGKQGKASEIELTQKRIDEGTSNPQWFYFYPDAELKQELER